MIVDIIMSNEWNALKQEMKVRMQTAIIQVSQLMWIFKDLFPIKLESLLYLPTHQSYMYIVIK